MILHSDRIISFIRVLPLETVGRIMREDPSLSRIQKASEHMKPLKLLRPRQFQDQTKLNAGLQTPAPNPSFVFTFPVEGGHKEARDSSYGRVEYHPDEP